MSRPAWPALTVIDRWALAAALGWFMMWGTVSAFVTHDFTFFPDSRQHYRYIDVLKSGRLPYLDGTKITQEQHQPPLYYLAAVPWAAIGEQWSIDLGVLFVRLFTLLIGAGTIFVTAVLARFLFPDNRYLTGLASLLVAMNPQFYVMSAQVNNDAAASLGGAVLLLLAVLLWFNHLPSKHHQTIVGLMVAFAFLVKMSLWPLALIVLSIASLKGHWQRSSLIRLWTPLLLIGGAWVGRNIIIYGDPTVLRRMRFFFWADQHRDFLTPTGVRQWGTLLFESYWTRFRYFVAGLRHQEYMFIKAATVVAAAGMVIGVVRHWRTWTRPMRFSVMTVVCFFLVILVGTFAYSLDFYQPQGRYLFPVISAIALMLAFGLDNIVPRRLAGVIAAVAVAGLLVLNVSALRLLVFWG